MRMGRGGFSLMETMISVAVMVAVSAIVMPNVSQSLDGMKVQESGSSLSGWEDAIQAFKDDVRHYPSQNTQLTRRVTDWSSLDADLCGHKYPNGHSSRWSGPYIQAVFPANGLPISIGTMRNQLGYDAVNDQVILYVDQVHLRDAVALNDLLDGELDRTGAAPYLVNRSGRVQWATANSKDLFTLEFRTAGPDCHGHERGHYDDDDDSWWW